MNRNPVPGGSPAMHRRKKRLPWYRNSYSMMRLAVGMILGVWMYCLLIAPLYQKGDYLHIAMHQMFGKGITCSIIITGLCALGMVLGSQSKKENQRPNPQREWK